ncbi:MAG: coenzyme F420-0:L-glutamate ligase [Nitrososphaeraceae archaeon]|nr:coenzyme F420-0:L-glutamate ligase [Nitrososphaeraceae archaeon]MDW0331502.1 coenzyme F420-0:L-glutamate ligase [Nitrososphaeraceae archaeon]
MNQEIKVIPLRILKNVEPGDKIYRLILRSMISQKQKFANGDIVVIAQKIVSKAEGRIVPLSSLTPSANAIRLAKAYKKDARVLELILRHSKNIVKIANGVIISETKHGFVCANAGIDQSNIIKSNENALLLPDNPDASANQIMNMLREKTNREVAVIIADSFGRPFRNGQTNVAIGIAGLNAIKSYIGENDMFGKKLKVTEIAVVDELASAAELVMGKSKGIPVAIVRGFDFVMSKKASINELIRAREKDLFR